MRYPEELGPRHAVRDESARREAKLDVVNKLGTLFLMDLREEFRQIRCGNGKPIASLESMGIEEMLSRPVFDSGKTE
jgi:hypothetical protein